MGGAQSRASRAGAAVVKNAGIRESVAPRAEARPRVDGVAVRVRHILLGSELDARRALNVLKDGASADASRESPAASDADRFETLARTLSKCPSGKEAGGLLGWVRPGQLAREIEGDVFRMKKHEMNVLASRHGVHIIEILDRVEQDAPEPGVAENGQQNARHEPLEKTTPYFELLRTVSSSIKSREWIGVVPEGGLLPSDAERTSQHSSARAARKSKQFPRVTDGPVDTIPPHIDGRLNQFELRKILAEAQMCFADLEDTESMNKLRPSSQSREAALENRIVSLAQKFKIPTSQVWALLRYTSIYEVARTADSKRFAVWRGLDVHDTPKVEAIEDGSRASEPKSSDRARTRMSSFRELAGSRSEQRASSFEQHSPKF